MKIKIWTSDEICRQMLTKAAPLPCQRDFVRQVSVTLALHANRNTLIDLGIETAMLPAPSLLVIAPTGCGKTYLLHLMSNLLGVGVITVDASTLSREGYKGANLGQQLLAARETMPPDQFEKAILLLDEVDKLESADQRGSALPNILQLFNGGHIAVAKDNAAGAEQIDISRWLVILSGAFIGLDKIIKKRLYPSRGIGFGSSQEVPDLTADQLMEYARSEDLIQFGIMPELAGRIGSVLCISSLGAEDYKQLLSIQPGTVLYQYSRYLACTYGVDLSIDHSAIGAITEQCTKSSTGARAVAPHLHKIMRQALMAVESDDTICCVTISSTGPVYLHGSRSTSAVTLHKQKAGRRKTLCAGSVQRLAGLFVGAYTRAEGNPRYLPEINALLICALYYITTFTSPEDWTIQSLITMAGTLQSGPGDARSTFSILCIDKIEKSTFQSRRMKQYYEDYIAHFNKRTPTQMNGAVRLIRERLCREYAVGEILYQIIPEDKNHI